MSNEKILLTVEETAKAIGCGRAHIFNLINRGLLPTVRLGRTTRIPRAWLEEYVAEVTKEWQKAQAQKG